MQPSEALADFDVQVRQSTVPDGPGVIIEADGAVIRRLAPAGQGPSQVTWSRLDAASADTVISAQLEFFRSRGEELEWKLYDYDEPPDLAARLVAAGFVPDDEELLMVAQTAQVAAEVPLPAGVRLAEATGEAGVDQLFDVHVRVFGGDESRLRSSLLARLGESPPSVEMVVALAGDEPVCAARIEYPPGSDFAGLWGGGTVPAWRGKGIYRALVAYRARLAAARGYRYLQVDALPTSQPILTRLGFVALAHTTPYIWDRSG
jgi:GNAT superfamily N-acetyltransferase